MTTKTVERLDKLITNYLAEVTMVTRESELENQTPEKEIQIWGPLATNLRLPVEYLIQYWNSKVQTARAVIWLGVIDRRIQNLAAHQTFQAGAADRVVHKAMDKLEALLDGNLIRNPGELLAIAKLRTNTAPSTVINNFTGATLAQGQTLPGNDSVIMLDLSPQTARRITEPPRQKEERIIDATMIGVKDLRELATDQPEEGNQNGYE